MLSAATVDGVRRRAQAVAQRVADHLRDDAEVPLTGSGPGPATSEDVRAAYRLLLGREPDPGGAAHYAARIAAGSVTPEQVAEEITSSPEFLRRWRKFAAVVTPTELAVRVDDFTITVDPLDWAIGATIAEVGDYEPEVTHLLRSLLEPGAVFIDIGANIGWHALVGAAAVGPTGRVVAIEPNPRNCDLMAVSREANSYDNIEVVNAALSDSAGWMALETDASNGHAVTLGPVSAASEPRACSFVVPSIGLDDLLAARDLTGRVAVMKIDVEGNEARVLRRAARVLAESRPTIVFEWYPELIRNEGDKAEAPMTLLRELGYGVAVVGHPSAVQPFRALDDDEIERIRIDRDRPLLDLIAFG